MNWYKKAQSSTKKILIPISDYHKLSDLVERMMSKEESNQFRRV